MHSSLFFLALHNIVKPALKNSLPSQDGEDRHPNGTPEDDEEPEDDLLEGRHGTQINRIKPRFRHGGDDEEKGVCVGDAEAGVGRAVEDE